jgi:hypothetical protein
MTPPRYLMRTRKTPMLLEDILILRSFDLHWLIGKIISPSR